MNKQYIESRFGEFVNQDTKLREDIKSEISMVLCDAPNETLEFPKTPAFCIDYDGAGYREVEVYGVRSGKWGVLEVSLALDGDHADWSDPGYIRSEHDHHCTINWLEVFDSIRLVID